MAKKVTGYIKLQIPAGKATPAPPVGPALGGESILLLSLHEFQVFLLRILTLLLCLVDA